MISDKERVISLEDDQEKKQEEKKEAEEKTEKPYLSDNEIKEYLERYRGRIPSVILRDIYEMLKGRRVTERQIDKIVERVESMLNADNQLRKIDDIYKKLESLEKMLRKGALSKSEKNVEEVVKSESESDIDIDVKDVKSGEKFDERLVEKSRRGVEKLEETFQDYAHPEYPERRYEKGELREYRDYGYPRYPARRDYQVSYQVRLARIPEDAKRIMLLLKWIEFLMERVGYDGLEDVLNYYVDINWISEDVLMAVLRYARGIKLYHENSDWRPAGYMSVQDHLMSLLYIEALRTGRFDRNLVMEVEKDLYRMKKEVAELHGI